MQYLETELFFTEIPSADKTKSMQLSKGVNDNRTFREPSVETLGIKVRIGNQPLVYNLKELSKNKGAANSADPIREETKDYYLVVHAIGAARISGKAKVEELQYF